MSFVDALSSAEVLGALLLLTLASLAELPLEHFLKSRRSAAAVLHFAWDWFLGPLWRALAIAGFVLLAYPASYGVRRAPGLAALAADGTVGATALVNILFLATLVPPLRRHGGLLLATQGGLATAIVFGWYAAYIGARSVSYWPGLSPALLVVMMAVLGYRAAQVLGRTIGESLDGWLGTHGLAQILAHTCAQVMRAPAVLLYGYALGVQIAI